MFHVDVALQIVAFDISWIQDERIKKNIIDNEFHGTQTPLKNRERFLCDAMAAYNTGVC